ncbi:MULTISPECIES: anti-phage protein KwaA [Porphyromonas]|uniref:anti-phage protein KwaA n=1 Tax=Porphyromonas TaxID=836 RepID=UPI00046EF626|nr:MULTISPECIES: anti-phage protein KwaA [Porphyromonas]KGL47841.1 membrane protein [Porphyromonas cangingivalis]
MIKKAGFFFLSLWLLFVMIIIITIRIPICFSKDYSFVGISYLLSTNIIPLCSSLALFIGGCSYFNLENQLKGTKELSFKITEIENIDYEHLTFLTTYIIPLVCFQFENLRYVIVFVILLIVIGLIYIRTDIFYTNPTLALLKFRIYKVTGTFRKREVRENIIIITKEELNIGDDVKYIKLDKRIYYASKVKTDE